MGKDTTLIASTTRAKARPTRFPTMIIAQPAGVVKSSLKNAAKELGNMTHASGCTGPNVRSEERRVGKEWSVRVDLGGRRLIKTKTKLQNNPLRNITHKNTMRDI